jgi:broad specificity phosphatase PhoE
VRLYVVRHAAVTIRRDVPLPQWHLSPEGRAAAEALAEEPYWAEIAALYTSAEPKAVGTAQRIAARHGLPIRIDPDLREVDGRTWVAEGYREQVRRYLAGEPVDGWEPREAALARVGSCIDGVVAANEGADVAVVSHGLVLTLCLAGLLDLDATASFELWTRLRFPDVAVVDPEARQLERAFGAYPSF